MPTLNVDSNFGITMNGHEAGVVLLEPLFVPESPLSTFQVLRNVKTHAKMWTLRSPGRLLQANTGCGWNGSGTVPLDPNILHVGRVKANVEQCVDEFYGTVLEGVIVGAGLDVDKMDTPEGKRMFDAMITMLNQSTQLDMYELAWLNDYDNAGSTATPAFFANTLRRVADDSTTIPGIIQILDDYQAMGKVDKILNPSNAEYSGTAMTTTLAVALLKGLYNNQPLELRGIANNMKVFKVTTDIYDFYREYLQALGTEIAHTQIMNGIPFLTYNGIPIEPHFQLQQTLTTSSSATYRPGFGLTLPHFGMLTVQGNLVLGTDISSGENQVKIWWEEKPELMHYKTKIKLGMGIAHESLVVYSK